MNACVDRVGPRLVELAFVRSLASDERRALEVHLAACGSCVERYRRLQLAHRILAVGAERAVEEPAPLELERIAEGLGLVAPPRPSFAESFARLASSVRLGLAASSARARVIAVLGALVVGTTSAVLLLALPARDDGLVARGSAAGVSVAAYAVEVSGRVTVIEPSSARVPAGAHLKLRVSSAPDTSIGAVCVGVWTPSSSPRVTCLAPPAATADVAATVPGSVALDLAYGPASIVVVTSSGHEDPRALEALFARRVTDAELTRGLGAHALGIDRFTVEIVAPEGAP